MSHDDSLLELSLDDPLLTQAGGGEVGATGMGDDYHYTGQRNWYDCMMHEMTGGSGYQKTVLQAFASCTF